MKDRTIIDWDPPEWEQELSKLKDRTGKSTDCLVREVGEAINQAFNPIEWALYDRLRQRKRRLIEMPRILGCLISLRKVSRASPYVLGKYFCTDVTFNPVNLMNLPVDNQVVGPIAVRIFRQAVEAFDKSENFPAEIAEEILLEHEGHDYCYNWVIKNASLKRLDFRIKVEISESYERTTGALTLSSTKQAISKTFKVYENRRSHPLEDQTGPLHNEQDVINRLNDSIMIGDLASVKLDPYGIHLAPSWETHLAKVFSETSVDEKYRITLSAEDLGPEISSALKIT